MTGQKTTDQKRAAFAWECAEQAGKNGIINEYTNLVKSTASLIMSSGLMQTLAFLQAKKDKHHLHYEILLSDLCKWIGIKFMSRSQDTAALEFDVILTGLNTLDSTTYMQVNSEMMALMTWLRQLADARKAMEKS